MDLLAPLKRFDTFQQRHEALAIPVAVIKKTGDDQGGNLAALVAYYAFFSLFPLLLVFVTLLGFVLTTSQLQSVEHSVAMNFPGLTGRKGIIQFTTLKGSAFALIFGIVASLYSGLGVTNGVQVALDTVWAVPKKERPDFLQSKLRGLFMLLSLGVLFIVATLVSGIVSAGFGGAGTKILGILVSYLVNCGLFFAAFRFTVDDSVPTRALRSGILLAAFFWTLLQSLGGLYVHHVLKSLSGTYGIFAIVIALLVFLHLGARLTLYAAELNVVLERHLWPRSLFGPPDQPADQRTLADIAKIEERHDIETVQVSFSEPPPT